MCKIYFQSISKRKKSQQSVPCKSVCVCDYVCDYVHESNNDLDIIM